MSVRRGMVTVGLIVATLISQRLAVATQPNETESLDPFAEIEPVQLPAVAPTRQSWLKRFFSDNFGFRKELMSEFGLTDDGSSASRQSVGFELVKKFSSKTKTLIGIDLQGRLVRRDGFVGSLNDGEGMNRPGWFFEYHNAYVELYNLVDGVNLRIGHFYVPFGLNLSTDTHGTILQLSNERNFGFDRDWAVGVSGSLGKALRFDAYYLVGSGYAPEFHGQKGLGVARISLGNRYSYEHGLEAGVSFMAGERLAATGRMETTRGGVDVRYRHAVPTGLVTWTSEVSAGWDDSDSVFTQLHQLDYLHASRRFGLSSQFRWFWQRGATDSSVFAEATWYLANDVAGGHLHWLKLNTEIKTQTQHGERNVVWTLQYYRYW